MPGSSALLSAVSNSMAFNSRTFNTTSSNSTPERNVKTSSITTTPLAKTPPLAIHSDLIVTTKASILRASRHLPPKKYPVKFDVPHDIQVFWDGTRVNQKHPLPKQSVGKHYLRLEKPGLKPIYHNIIVKADEPTVIRVH